MDTQLQRGTSQQVFPVSLPPLRNVPELLHWKHTYCQIFFAKCLTLWLKNLDLQVLPEILRLGLDHSVTQLKNSIAALLFLTRSPQFSQSRIFASNKFYAHVGQNGKFCAHLTRASTSTCPLHYPKDRYADLVSYSSRVDRLFYQSCGSLQRLQSYCSELFSWGKQPGLDSFFFY